MYIDIVHYGDKEQAIIYTVPWWSDSNLNW